MRIVCIDPGRLSGIAFGAIRANQLHVSDATEISYTPAEFYAFLTTNRFDHIIIEGFEYRPKYKAEASLDLYPCYLIGVAMCYADQTRTPLYVQPAREGLQHFDEKKLDELGLYYKGGKGHARVAIMHLCHWAEFGAGYQLASQGIHPGTWHFADRTDAQRHPKPRRPRRTGEIEF